MSLLCYFLKFTIIAMVSSCPRSEPYGIISLFHLSMVVYDDFSEGYNLSTYVHILPDVT